MQPVVPPIEMRSLTSLIDVVASRLSNSQNPAGYWSECFDTGHMPNAQTVIYLHFLGIDDAAWTTPLLTEILKSQRIDGSWGLYPLDDGDLSTSVECYYALELYGWWQSVPTMKTLAQSYILNHGGLKKCRNLTKVMLAIGGEIPWKWLPAPKFYLHLFAKTPLIAIWDLVAFTRLHVPPMLVLAASLYVENKGKSPVLGNLIRTRRPNFLQREARMFNKPSARRHVLLRTDAMFRCIEWMKGTREVDGTVGGYHTSSFLVLFALRAIGYAKNHREILSVIDKIRQTLFHDAETDYWHQQTCDAHVWNTALAMKALRLTEHHPTRTSIELQKAEEYLVSKQQHLIGEWALKNVNPPGGWGFSSSNSRHPDVDDTVACLEALFPSRSRYSSTWWSGVHWLLGMQNRDGGWSAFEKDCDRRWLEWLPANDMKRAMIDPSTPDITGRVVEFLLNHQVLPENDETIVRAVKWLRKHQESDGSWFGRWGTTYIYGTWCVVKALSVCRMPSDDKSIRKSKQWLMSVQHPDGSFGESCLSDLQGKFIPLQVGVPSQTAWGADALLYLYEMEEIESEKSRLWQSATKAVCWLCNQAVEGVWYEEMPTGSAFPGALHIRYHIYPKVWPLVALCHYRALQVGTPLRGGEINVRSKIASYVSS